MISVYAVVVAGTYYDAGGLYWVGAALFVGLLTYQHMRFTPRNLSRIGTAAERGRYVCAGVDAISALAAQIYKYKFRYRKIVVRSKFTS